MSGPSPGASSAATVRTLRVVPGRGPLLAALVTMRPKQWLKNTLVVAAAGAAGALGQEDVPLRVSAAFIAFCVLSSGIYAVNDVRDREEDRQHPRKCRRPIAAGELDPGAAVILGFALMASGLALSAAVRPLLALVAAGYLGLTLTYTMVWRHVPILDVFAISGGFVLRAVAGGVAAPVTLSRWFILVITFSAVFVAAAKRHAELVRATDSGAAKRKVLHFYTARRLHLVLYGSAACALFAYCVWAFAVPTIDGVPWRPLTIIPFAACLARYGTLVKAGGGESPEDVILRDRTLIIAGLAWLIIFALGVHAAS